MSMLAIIQPASAPNPGSARPGIKGQADKSEFQVKDHAPPGPEPPPPDHLAKGEEASSDKPNASSKKPDSLPEASSQKTQFESRADLSANTREPDGPDGTSGAADPNSSEAAQAVAFAAAIATPNPAALFDVALGALGVGAGQPDLAIPGIDSTDAGTPTADTAVGLGPKGAAGETPVLPLIGAEATPETGFARTGPASGEDVAVSLDPAAEDAAVDPESASTGMSDANANASAQTGDGRAGNSIADASVLQKLRPIGVETPNRGIESPQGSVDDGGGQQANAPEAVSPSLDPTAGGSAGGQTQSEASNSNGSQTGGQSADNATPNASANKLNADAPAMDSMTPASAVEAAKAGASVQSAPRTEDAAKRPDGMGLEPAETRRALHQVADRIEMLAAIRPKDGVTVRLDPEHLGTITIKVLGSAKEVTAELTASNDSVRAALREHSGELTQALSARGVQLQSVQVGAETAGTLGGRHQGASQGFDQAQTARFHHGFRREATTDGFTLEQARGFARRATGVDVWV